MTFDLNPNPSVGKRRVRMPKFNASSPKYI
ncbi:hypothetical protein CCACVL1_01121 [Corchorus capsularis]|uniref:Uncharacterized protein n=1 Tax=Corchorus capsularis TaxID=210143 RepID=A0A1R3KMN9_COCAP|nr:hypothetical protein CCACVL1_01121 [Corchorus capsularis]